MSNETTLDDVLAERFKSGNSVPVERAYITADEFAELRAALEDARRLEWLREHEYDLVTIREDIGEDEYAIWWFVVDGRKGTKRHIHSISGHPQGSPRDAIDAAQEVGRD